MVNDDKYRIGKEDIELLSKLDNIFIKESELLFYKEIAGKQIKNTLIKSASFKAKLRIAISSTLAIAALVFFAFIIFREDNKIDDLATEENLIFTELKEDNIVIDSNSILLDTNSNEIDKSTERFITPDPRAKRIRLPKQDGAIEAELNASNVMAEQVAKAQNIKIVDGFELASRESVISTSITLKNGISLNSLQSKLAIIMQKLNLDYQIQNGENDVINVTTKKYPGEMKSSEKVLFAIQLKVSKENNSKLQLMLRFNKIQSIIDGNNVQFKNIDQIYYKQLKNEVLNNLKEFIN